MLNKVNLDYDETHNKFNVALSISYSFNQHEIHTDAIKKIYSGILYISDENLGTELYENEDKKSLKKIVRWEKNKLFLFKRTDNSWHNFRAIRHKNILRIVYNLNISVSGHSRGGNYKYCNERVI